MRNLELFAGCGGLSLGLSRAGFTSKTVIELDQHAANTLRFNQLHGKEHFKDWSIFQEDVTRFQYGREHQDVDLLSGGPPCQPFSIGGRHLGPNDPRNLWPEAFRGVRETQPKSFLFENVRGLLRPGFADYLEYIVLQLRWPDVAQRSSSCWRQHACELRKLDASAPQNRPYEVLVRGINAADYGAAQKRHRVLIMGVRTDVCQNWSFPEATHSQLELVRDKFLTENYWRRHGISEQDSFPPSPTEAKLMAKLQNEDLEGRLPWVTVRDRLRDLPPPQVGGEDPNHYQHPGAKAYRNHTGSLPDEPAKALKAGAHGVPGGENMLAHLDGSVRYFTVREMALLQGFGRDFIATGGWRHVTRQLGNAVPAEIGEAFGKYIFKLLNEAIRQPLAA